MSRRAYLFYSNEAATPPPYSLSLHDALPISNADRRLSRPRPAPRPAPPRSAPKTHTGRHPLPTHPWVLANDRDRKSTRLNSSHGYISYAVFCLKKKTKQRYQTLPVHLNLACH